jgi:hypothetical protein
MDLYYSLIFIIIITFICICYYIYNNVYYIKSNIDNKYYLVKHSSDNLIKQEKVDILVELNKRVDKLIYYLSINYNNNYVNLPKYKNVNLLLKRFSPDLIGENIFPFGTSYTFNKGSFIGMCIDTKNKDINTMMYVLLHELAHVGSESVGHTQEFLNFFRFLIKISIQLNIYQETDYINNPKEYCGLNINQNI